MKLKLIIYFNILLILPLAGLCSEQVYKEFKRKIDHLENSMIQDFSINLPKNQQDRYGADYSKAATQLEVKYQIQRKLFYKIEERYFHLNTTLDKNLADNTLSKEETEKLKTQIEYATRIIMRSRKLEIHEMYKDLKGSLTYCPKLSEIYKQLSSMNFNNCSLNNIKLDEQTNSLTFEVKKKNKFGSWTTSTFQVTHKDMDSGRLISHPAVAQNAFPYHNFVTEFWTNLNPESQQKFTLHINHLGNIIGADFTHNTKEPLMTLLGFELGSQKVKKEIGCDTPNRFPATSK